MIQFIRNYYIFVYYKIAVINKDKKSVPSRTHAFIAMSVFVIAMQLMTLLVYLLKIEVSIVEDIYNSLNVVLADVYRGNLTAGLLLVWIVSSILTYLIFCLGVKFEEIPQRLSIHKFFEDMALWKAILPVVVQAIILLTVL